MITRQALTADNEKITVKMADKRGDRWLEILDEPIYIEQTDKYYPYGRQFHWSELIFLD